jgi:OOP family OmpA-OmpF porin
MNGTTRILAYLLLTVCIAISAGCASSEVVKIKDQMTLRIQFDYNKASIMESATPELNEAIRFVNRYPGSRIEILGHTDNIGTPQYNQVLSEKRAEAVRHYLVKEGGVDPAKISSKGFRDLYPVAQNRFNDGRDNPEGRALNRRVEINIMAD